MGVQLVDYIRDAYLCSRMEVGVLRELIHYVVDLHGDEFEVATLCRKAGMSEREIGAFERRFVDG